MQQHMMEPPHSQHNVKVTPSRRTLNNRFPSLCFFVETGSHPFFELLLTSDRGLFHPARAGDRQAGNFYSSREDVGLLDARDGRGAFHVPPVVVRNFAQQNPHPDRLYYVAIAYATEQGNEPLFSHPPETLADAAESISLADNFIGTTLSQVLGTHAERLKTVGGRRPGPGGLPLYPMPDHNRQFQPNDDSSEPAYPEEHLPGQRLEDHPAPEYKNSRSNYQGHGSNGASPVRTAPGAAPDAELDYDDGFGDFSDSSPAPAQPVAADARNGYGNDGYGNDGYGDDGYGDDDYDDAPPAIHGDGDSTQNTYQDHYNGYDSASNGSGKNGMPLTTPPQAPQKSRDRGLPELDIVDDITAQSLENNAAEPGPVSPKPSAEPDGAELTDSDKRRLIERVASLEHGEPRYAAINPDGEFKGRFGRDNAYYQRAHVGLSYGIGPFTQDSGALGKLLAIMQQRDSAYFETVFGPAWQELLQVTNAGGPGSLESDGGRSARVQPVAGSDLWESDWVERFRLAGGYPPFQAAQNQLAAELFLEPAQALARHLGLASERGIAVLYDRCTQMGVTQARDYLLEQLSPIRTEAQRSAALASLMAGQEDARLASFQRRVGLPADGQWNAATHARMLGALREQQRQGREIPLPLPDYEEMLDTLVTAARGRPWEQRLNALRNDPELTDAPYLP